MKRRKKSILSTMLVLTLSMGTVMNVHAVTIDEAQQKADQLENQKSAAESEKQSLANQLNTIANEMEEIQNKIDKKLEEIQKAEDELVQAKVNENAQYQSMKKRIKFMYENGNTQMIEVLLESDNIGDFLNKAEYAQSLSEYDREQLTVFQDVVKQVEEEEAALKEEYAEMEVLRSELIAKQDNVSALLEEKKIQISNLEKEIGDNASVLQDLIKKAEEERIRQEEAAAAAAAAAAAEAERNNANSGGSSSGGGGYATYFGKCGKWKRTVYTSMSRLNNIKYIWISYL